jgi:integrase/recombinase XerD
MNQEIINTIMYQMNLHLDNQQLMKLKQVLEQVMNNNDESEDDSFELLNLFIATKKLEGRSDKTLKYYRNTVNKMLQAIDKNVHYQGRQCIPITGRGCTSHCRRHNASLHAAR